MKKTLIALMALASVACADFTGAQMDTWLQGVLTHRGGSKYTLTIQLSENYQFSTQSRNIFDITSEWTIREQQSAHVGLAINDDCGGGSFASRNNDNWDNTTIIDLDTASSEGTAMYQGWFYSGSECLRGATLTIYSANNDTRITFQAADGTTVTMQRDAFYAPTNAFGFKEEKLANQAVYKSASILYDHNGVPSMYSIPEPATATLSLLALCGLAARRRRA